MGQLTDTASKRFAKATRRAHVPEWYRLATPVGLGALGVILVVSLIMPNGDAEVVATGPDVVPVPTATATLEPGGTADPLPTETTPSTTPSELPSSPTTSVDVPLTNAPTLTGTTVDIPTQAYTNALAAAGALYTGTFDGVLLDPDASVPVVVPDATARVTGMSVDTVTPASISFVAAVTTASGEQQANLTLALVDGIWVYSPQG